VLAHRVARGQGLEYELVYDGEGDAGGRFLMGLADMAQFQEKTSAVAAALPYDTQRSGDNGERSAPGRGVVGGRSGAGRGDEIAVQANTDAACGEAEGDGAQNVHQVVSGLPSSYRKQAAPALAGDA
jgi:DNA primase